MAARLGGGFLGEMPTDIWSRLYTSWLRMAGASIGRGSVVHRRVKVWRPENIEIGMGVSVPASTDMAGMGKIIIGDYTLIGANVRFVTNHHPIEDSSIEWERVLEGTQQSVRIGKYCWIMNDVRIIAGAYGVGMGDYAMLAAGATAVSDVPESELWGGTPARYIRRVTTNRPG